MVTHAQWGTVSPGRVKPCPLQHMASQLTQGVGTQVANSGSRRVDSHSEEAIGVEVMHIPLTHHHYHPSATQHTNCKGGCESLPRCMPRRKGIWVWQRTNEVLPPGLSEWLRGVILAGKGGSVEVGVPKSSTPSHRALFWWPLLSTPHSFPIRDLVRAWSHLMVSFYNHLSSFKFDLLSAL